jgi:Kef-type K+ transport system membrane component KefB
MGIGFGTLLVIALAGLAGPLLGLGRRFVPAVVGEILAGIIVGPAVLGAVHPAESGLAALAEVGFAMLMLNAGMHLPVREPRLAPALRAGALAALGVVVAAIPGGLLAATILGGGHGAVFAVVLASGSAALVIPALQEAKLRGPAALAVVAQVAVADVVTIVAVPFVLQPHRAGRALLGALPVVAAAVALVLAADLLSRLAVVHDARRLSRRRQWALDLRLSLIALFGLAWLAQKAGTSVLLAGLAAGIVVAYRGGPKRLSTQMRGIADGFFVPLYLVVLGARLDVGGLFSHPRALALAAGLGVLNAGIHLLVAALMRRPLAGALAACAQLGVPAAVASLGLSEHAISAVTATAIVASALLSLAIFTLGVELMQTAQAAAGAGSGDGSASPAAA